jgi:lipopolysaccharide transport system permease protein
VSSIIYRSPLSSRRALYLRDLLYELVVRDFKLRYNRSILGIGWSLLAPLAQLGILSFVFRVVVPVNVPNFTTFLFAGLLPWTWFSSSLLAAATAAHRNKDLVQQVGFPVAMLPVIAVMSEFLHMVLALPILVFFMWIDGQPLSLALAALPAIALLQFVLTLALSFIVAPLQMLFHDTEHLLRIALLLLFYVSAVFYAPDSVPPEFAIYYLLNPIVYLLTAYRTILIGGAWPALGPFLVWSAACLVLLVASYRFYMRLHFRFIQEI